MTDPTRLLAFADRLRQLRKTAGLNGRDLAARTSWTASKVSRLETGQQKISEADLQAFADALGLQPKVSDELFAEMRAIRLDDARWKARLRAAGHEGAQMSHGEAEHNATTIVNFESALVPGLVQTPGYARMVFASMAALKGEGDDLDAAVAARLKRQAILYDETKTIELLVYEAALRPSVAPPDTMAAQLDRLVAVSALPNVRFGIVPLDKQLPFPPLHGFAILDDLVNVELFHTEANTRVIEDGRIYKEFLAAMWPIAAEKEKARALLLGLLDRLKG